MRRRGSLFTAVAGLGVLACQSGSADRAGPPSGNNATSPVAELLAQYTPVRLTANLDGLSEKERQMLPLLIQAAQAMDTVYWQQVYAARDSLLAAIPDSATRRYLLLNYGPWDRLQGNRPFVPGIGPRPAGAEFYPHDVTKDEFEAAAAKSSQAAKSLRGLYTVVRRDSAGGLRAIPYREAYAAPVRMAAAKLREASALAEDPGLRRYLELRARALETDDYQPSDLAWLDMKNNNVDLVIGPIETYDDALFGYKAAHEAYVLLKDKEWSKRLSHYAALLPGLQRGLPVPAAYKHERPGLDSDLNAYDVLFYSGQANAGSKTIAINLPNDEEVQLRKGTRRLQLKNAMRAKFDRILVPIADQLVSEDQQPHVNFDAFFANIMFHEVAHGLGIKNTINRKGTVRAALREQAGALEEAKADVLGLYMISRLQKQGEMTGTKLEDNYVTYLAGIFRSIRFGASSAHGRANAAQLSFYEERGAFTRDSASGRHRVDFARMGDAVDSLAARILRFQGDGDYQGVSQFMTTRTQIAPPVQKDLARLGSSGIPVDIVFEQGPDVLGLSTRR